MDASIFTSFGQTGAVLAMAWFFLTFLQKRDEANQKAQDDRDNRQKDMFIMLQDKFELLSKNANQVIKENTDIVQKGNVLTEKLCITMSNLVQAVQTVTGNQRQMVRASDELRDAITKQTKEV